MKNFENFMEEFDYNNNDIELCNQTEDRLDDSDYCKIEAELIRFANKLASAS